MKRLRHRQRLTRFASLAIAALLWSQLVVAAHPLCSTAAATMPELTMAMAGTGNSCHHEKAPSKDQGEAALCLAHCSQGGLTNDVARVPAVPPLPAAVPAAVPSFVFLAAEPTPYPALPPPVSWHRPTAHPAALLLF